MAGNVKEVVSVQEMLVSILKRGSYKHREKGIYYQTVSDKLSKIAKKQPRWTWRYIHQVERGHIEVSPLLAGAIEKMYKKKKVGIKRIDLRVRCKDKPEQEHLLKCRKEYRDG